MTRVKKGVNALKHRKSILKRTKGFRHGRSTKERQATEALFHAGASAFAHRRDKKGDARRNWNVKISYGAKGLGTSYSKLMGELKKAGIQIDRKILATLVEQHPETFKKVVEMAKVTTPAPKKEKAIA
jgi:large subunit ribosomal protein L20